MSSRDKPDDQYPPDEAEKRLQAALRGARITGHKPMSDMKVGKRERQADEPESNPATHKRKPKR